MFLRKEQNSITAQKQNGSDFIQNYIELKINGYKELKGKSKWAHITYRYQPLFFCLV